MFSNLLHRGSPDRDALAVELDRLPRVAVAAVESFMRAHGLDRATLARELGVKPARVVRLLTSPEELSLGSLAGVAAALDAHVEIRLVPNSAGHVDAGHSEDNPPKPVDDRHGDRPRWLDNAYVDTATAR
jgi:hypothetical protein